MSLSYAIARILAAFSEKRAAEMNLPVAIALADAEGGLVYFGRMDDALPASNAIAIAKAYTAAVFRMSTRKLGELAQPGKMLYGVEHSLNERIVLFGGGLPLQCQNRIVGAVGISGGTVDEDIDVARAACAALQEMENWREYLAPLLSRIDIPQSRRRNVAAALEEALAQTDDPALKTLAPIVAGSLRLEGPDDG